MRWLAFVLLAVLAAALQISVGAAVRIPLGGSGLCVAIDFLAVPAVLVALRARHSADAVGAAWLLGLMIDLTAPGMPLGLYALAYAVAASAVFHTRGAVFSESGLTQLVIGLAFCLIAHGLARGFVNLYVRPDAGLFWRDAVQVLMVAAATAAVTPIALGLGRRLDWLIMVQPSWRRR